MTHNDNFKNARIARAFVAMQEWECPFAADEALRRGTIFPCLYLPFSGRTLKGGDCCD